MFWYNARGSIHVAPETKPGEEASDEYTGEGGGVGGGRRERRA